MSDNLYTEVLGIAPGDCPPHFYALLQVNVFEADGQVIHTAGLRQIKRLKQYQLHPDPQTAQRVQELLNQISRACTVLEVPEKKKDYDLLLAAELGIDLSQRVGYQVLTRAGEYKACPNCHVRMSKLAVLCIDCGYDFRTREVIQTEIMREPQLTAAPLPVARARTGPGLFTVKRIVLLVLLAAGAYGVWRGVTYVQVLKLRAEGEKLLADGRRGSDVLGTYETLARKGGAADRLRFAQLRISLAVPSRAGAWRIESVRESAAEGGGVRTNVDLSDVAGIWLEITECAWGQKQRSGTLGTTIWVNFLMVNAGEEPIEVDHSRFMLVGRERRWAGLKVVPSEARGGVTLAKGQGVRGSLFFGLLDSCPAYLEFNDARFLVRAPLTKHYLQDSFPRSMFGLPGGDAKRVFPFAVPLAERRLSEEEVAACAETEWIYAAPEGRPREAPVRRHMGPSGRH